jgi:hypothetical protein
MLVEFGAEIEKKVLICIDFFSLFFGYQNLYFLWEGVGRSVLF